MVICAGIDLLSKFYAGKEGPKTGKAKSTIGMRYKEFLARYFEGMSSDDAELLWQFRNSLMHSFGLWGGSPGQNDYGIQFGIRFQSAQLVQKIEDDVPEINRCLVDAYTLHACFEQSVMQYEQDVRSDSSIANKFNEMFYYYGSFNYASNQLECGEMFVGYDFMLDDRDDIELPSD